MALETINFTPSNTTQTTSAIARSIQSNMAFTSAFLNSAINRTTSIDRMRKQDDRDLVQEQQNNIANERAERFDRRNRMEFALDFGRKLDRDRENDGRFDDTHALSRDKFDESKRATGVAENHRDRLFKENQENTDFNQSISLDQEKRRSNESTQRISRVQAQQLKDKMDDDTKSVMDTIEVDLSNKLVNAKTTDDRNKLVREAIDSTENVNIKKALTRYYTTPSKTPTVSNRKEIRRLNLAIAKIKDESATINDGISKKARTPAEQAEHLKGNAEYQELLRQRKELGGIDEPLDIPTESVDDKGEDVGSLIDQANKFKSVLGIDKIDSVANDTNGMFKLHGFNKQEIKHALEATHGLKIGVDKAKNKALGELIDREKRIHNASSPKDINGISTLFNK